MNELRPPSVQGISIEPGQDARLEAHVAACASCKILLADLEAIQATAATLDRHKPSVDVWSRIALQVAAEPAFQQAAAARREREQAAGRRARALHVAGARDGGGAADRARRGIALGAVAIARDESAIERLTNRWPFNGDGNASSGALVESIEQELQQAASHYEKAIAGLEQVANASDSPLDPDVMATLKKNLTVIDKAIDESRTALRSAPTNTLAQESLFEAFRRKVALLQDTIALMNEMRKGNQAGAARIVEGLSKS